jgi:hypothetical protein
MPPPPRVLAALAAVADRLAAAGVPWLVTGSAGRALLGAPVRPGDVDLEVAAADVRRAAAALGMVAAPSAGGGGSSVRGATRVAGTEVDLSAAFVVEGRDLRLPDGFDLMLRWAVPAAAAGRRVLVAPPEEHLVRGLVQGDGAAVAHAVAGVPPLRAAYVAERLRSASSTAAR